ncbi:MAG: protein kinase, partial [Myxococcales bacterium]|nr:protein kinase [Myxococcales bacterium]
MSRRPQAGDVIRGKYRIIRLIGDGGMGTVYEAKHEVLGTPVALKFLHPELAKRPGLVSRFLQEAKVSASIQSPHVTRVTDVDQTEDGAAFIVMELLSGEPLQAVLDREHKLSRDRAIDFALQMLSGLEAAHALGVVHRDLKPDNVFITRTSGGPLLRLLDFGIAKLRETNEYKKGLTRPGAIMGTPEYMAPEQAYSADQVDHRADIYSMGAMLYEMLAGQRPANGEDAHMIISQVTTGRVKRITEYDQTIPEPLAEVIHRAMAPRPEDRFASATEMRLALARYAGELSHAGRLAATPAPPSGDYPPTEKDGGPPPASKSTVPKTLPPEDEAPPVAVGTEQGDFGKGGTQEVSPQVVQEQMRMTGMQPQSPYGPPPQGAVPGGTTP